MPKICVWVSNVGHSRKYCNSASNHAIQQVFSALILLTLVCKFYPQDEYNHLKIVRTLTAHSAHLVEIITTDNEEVHVINYNNWFKFASHDDLRAAVMKTTARETMF